MISLKAGIEMPTLDIGISPEIDILEKEPDIELEVNDYVGGLNIGTNNYENLNNKPKVNGVELSGDKSFEELGVSPLSNLEIMEIIKRASKNQEGK